MFKIGPWARRALVLLVFVIVPIFSIRPLYGVAKYWRARFFWRNAHHAEARGDWDEAERLTQLGLYLCPGRPDGYRLMAQMIDARRNGRSIGLWSQVLQTGQATDADRVALGLAALRENLTALAEEQGRILLSRPKPAKETYNLAGLLAMRQQKFGAAHQAFQKAVELDPGYTRALVNLARTELMDGNDQETLDRGIHHLKSLSSRKDEWGLESLRALVEWAMSHSGQLPFDAQLDGRLREHPLARIEDRCLAAEWEIKLTNEPKGKEAILETLTASASKLPLKDRHDLAAWLNRQRLYQKTLAVFPLDPKASDEMLLVQLDAMAALGRWRELDQFLTQDLFTFQPVLLWVFRARTARELGSVKRFEINWRRAVAEAGRNPQALRYLGEYATTLGEPERGIETYELLSRQPGCELEGLLKLLPVHDRLRQTRSMLRVVERLSALRPNDSAILNDLAYLGLLLDEPSTRPMDLAREVYTLNPHLPAFEVTYTLAELKAGKPAGALEAAREYSPQSWTAPGWRAIYAAALAANGRKTEALQIVKTIDLKQLRPEEKKLLDPFLAK